jgi:hypothetical protein
LGLATKLAVPAAALALCACGDYPSIEGDPLARRPTTLDSANAPDAAAGGGASPSSPSSGTGKGSGPPSGPSAPGQLHAFVTSVTESAALGGLVGADALCGKLAAAAGIGGTYRAWLSAGPTSPLDRITSNGPWYLVTGEMVVASKSQLATGVLTNALDKDEKGAVPSVDDDQVWSGTDPTGKPVGLDCASWTSANGEGIALVGEAQHADSRWTTRRTVGCDATKRLYCFEL